MSDEAVPNMLSDEDRLAILSQIPQPPVKEEAGATPSADDTPAAYCTACDFKSFSPIKGRFCPECGKPALEARQVKEEVSFPGIPGSSPLAEVFAIKKQQMAKEDLVTKEVRDTIISKESITLLEGMLGKW